MKSGFRPSYAALPLMIVCAQAVAQIGSIEASRPATVAEQQFIARMVSAFDKALPPLPAGWVFDEAVLPRLDMSVGVGSEKPGIALRYTWHISSNTREQKEAALLKKLEETQNERRDAGGLPKGTAPIQAKMDAIAAKIAAAAEKGDATVLQRYSAEMEGLGKQMLAAQDAASVPIDLQRKMVADTRAHLTFTINLRHASLSSDSMLLGSIPGAAFAFRTERDPDDTEIQREGVTTLLYGPWRKNSATGSFEAKYDPAKKYPFVQTVVVVVQAEAKRAEGLAKTLNVAQIQGWMR